MVTAIILMNVSRNKINEIAELFTGRPSRMDDIENTETLLACKAYSKHDSEAMFPI